VPRSEPSPLFSRATFGSPNKQKNPPKPPKSNPPPLPQKRNEGRGGTPLKKKKTKTSPHPVGFFPTQLFLSLISPPQKPQRSRLLRSNFSVECGGRIVLLICCGRTPSNLYSPTEPAQSCGSLRAGVGTFASGHWQQLRRWR